MYSLFHRVKDPAARYRFHVFMAWFWLATMVAVLFVHWESFGILAVMEVSLYANFATEFGAVDASKASDQTEGLDQ
jgi:1,4-dihydroxy-2-naphthoate octaprenyltransferase